MKSSIWKKHHDFRVLLVYPNIQMSALMPQSIGILTSMLKEDGFDVDIFDCTFYSDNQIPDAHDERLSHKMVQSFDWKDRGVTPKSGIFEDFKSKVEKFNPDLIAVSVLESTYSLGLSLIDYIHDSRKEYYVLFGGVFATYASEIIMKNNSVDFVCRGEGEDAIMDLCKRICAGQDFNNTPNLWVKSNGQLHINIMRAPLDINKIPFPNWDLFEPEAIYRPMQGKVWRTVGIETQRGCPYTCTYCNSPSNNIVYGNETPGKFYRKKTTERVREELDYLVKKYNPELIYFVVDTFLAMGSQEFDEFKEMYLDYKIPFWMNTRAETLNEHRAEGLEEMNMLRMNIGIEHGNYEYRKSYLKRDISNEKMIECFNTVSDRNYTVVANSIIGMPDETRELIFDTINFVRELPEDIDTSGAFVWTPYHGTGLRDLAVEKGYLNRDTIIDLAIFSKSILEMPSISPDEIEGLARTFSFYVKFPENRFSEIELAESLDESGTRKWKELSDEFDSKWRLHDVEYDI
tara:strand:+ start:137 stop:1687 length:1551 start_codon:yes stop_codon:yes gene_type:complete